MAKGNKTYKDRLFCFLFGSEENKAWTLSLYNAVNGSHYTDPNSIEITTIKSVMYLGIHNDVSFMISGEMNLYEQQSSYNPNMPVRMLQYAGNLYEKYIANTEISKYSSTLMPLPAPRLIVFYNGVTEQPSEKILRLSDSFPAGAKSDIEVTVRMLNINAGRNQDILDACKPLAEYAWLVAEIRKSNPKANTEELSIAIDRAIATMPDDFVIRPFLRAHQAEVKGMLLTEYNEAEEMERLKRTYQREGQREGLREGRIEVLCDLVRKGLLSIKDAVETADMSEESFMEKMAEFQFRGSAK